LRGEGDDRVGIQAKLKRYIHTSALHELIQHHTLVRANPRDAMRVANCAKPGAFLWLAVLPVEAELEMSNDVFAQALRHQHGLAPNGTVPWICRCDQPMVVGHTHTCENVKAGGCYVRHQAVVVSLANAADAHCGVAVTKSPPITSFNDLFDNQKNGTKTVPDISFLASYNTFATDVTVLYGDGDSYVPKITAMEKALRKGGSAALQQLSKKTTSNCRTRCTAKHNKYDADCKRVGQEFEAFVMESHGWLHDSAVKVIHELATNAFDVHGVSFGEAVAYLKRRVAVALQRGNAWLEQYARQRTRPWSFADVMGSDNWSLAARA